MKNLLLVVMILAKKDNRTRNWTFILYPESCVKDFKKVISDMHIEAVLSPLHDKDIDPTGEPKKPHYHVMMCFPGNKSFDQMNDISKSLGGTFPQPVLNTRSDISYIWIILININTAVLKCFPGVVLILTKC